MSTLGLAETTLVQLRWRCTDGLEYSNLANYPIYINTPPRAQSKNLNLGLMVGLPASDDDDGDSGTPPDPVSLALLALPLVREQGESVQFPLSNTAQTGSLLSLCMDPDRIAGSSFFPGQGNVMFLDNDLTAINGNTSQFDLGLIDTLQDPFLRLVAIDALSQNLRINLGETADNRLFWGDVALRFSCVDSLGQSSQFHTLRFHVNHRPVTREFVLDGVQENAEGRFSLAEHCEDPDGPGIRYRLGTPVDSGAGDGDEAGSGPGPDPGPDPDPADVLRAQGLELLEFDELTGTGRFQTPFVGLGLTSSRGSALTHWVAERILRRKRCIL